MLIPAWAVVGALIAFVLLAAWSIVAAFAWWGLHLQLEEAEADGRRLRIDIYDQRMRGATRPFGDRAALAADRDGRELGEFRP